MSEHNPPPKNGTFSAPDRPRTRRPTGSFGLFARTLFVQIAEGLDGIENLAAPFTARSMHQAIQQAYQLETPYDRRFRRAIALYQKHNLIHLGHRQVRLTPKGRIRWRTYQLETMELTRPKRWDGRWRIVIWDVPEKKRKARDTLRAILKQLGFRQIQRSVWVVPWPCRDEIDFLRDRSGLGPSLLYLESDEIDGSEHLRDAFDLPQ